MAALGERKNIRYEYPRAQVGEKISGQFGEGHDPHEFEVTM